MEFVVGVRRALRDQPCLPHGGSLLGEPPGAGGAGLLSVVPSGTWRLRPRFLSSLRDSFNLPRFFSPRLAPWAAFFRRFAAGVLSGDGPARVFRLTVIRDRVEVKQIPPSSLRDSSE